MEPNKLGTNRGNTDRSIVCSYPNVNNIGGEMKNLGLIAVLLAALAIFGCNKAEAGHLAKSDHVHDKEDSALGIKADAPNLVSLSENWKLGVEGGKDLNGSSVEDGWFGFLKVTFTGTLFDAQKGE
jgi:hypothetical protein